MSTFGYTWLSRIQLSDHEPESGKVIVSVDEVPSIRISADLAKILRFAIQKFPNIDAEIIAAAVGTSVERVEETLQFVASNPALRREIPKIKRRLQFRAPCSIQLTLLNPSKVLDRVPLIVKAVRSPWWWRSQIVLSIIGVLLIAFVAVTPDSPIHLTMSVNQYIGVFVSLFLTIFVHEFAHAITLVAYGGKSQRLGFMLFYLAPAFFCDVSDAWLMPPKRRIRIALAGILTQSTVAAVAALIALMMKPSVAVAFYVFALLCLIYGLINIIPFVKLDGYIALIGYLDQPNLRESAIRAFQRRLANILLGNSRKQGIEYSGLQSRDSRESFSFIIFGFACAVFPIILVLGAGLAVNNYLASWGVLGAWITLAVFALIMALGIIIFWRGIVRIVCRANSSIRAVIVLVVSITTTIVIITLIPLPQQITGGVIESTQGSMLAIVGATSKVPLDSKVTIYRSAVFPSQKIGTAIVNGSETPCSVPLGSVLPMTGTSLQADALCFPLTTSTILTEPSVAVVANKGVPLARQIIFLINRTSTQ